MELWRPYQISFAVLPLAGMVVTTVVLALIAIVYYAKLRRTKVDEAPGKFVILISTVVYFVRGLVVDIVGPKHVKLTPYFVLIFVWIATSNVIVLIGYKEVSTSLTVPLVFALLTWVISQILAVKYQKWSYFNKFLFRIKIKDVHIPIMVNPLNIIEKITPIISLSVRLWGNMTAGATIYALIWWSFGGFTAPYPQIGVLLIAGTLIVPFLYAYFTIFVGIVQAFVFAVLTAAYFSVELYEGAKIEEEKQERKQKKLLAQKIKEEQRVAVSNEQLQPSEQR